MTGTVLVTGGQGGIGRAIVGALTESGHAVCWTARTGGDRLVPGAAFGANLSLPEDRRRLIEAIRAEAPFAGFVHVAGMAADALVAAVEPVRARAAMEVNFWSFVELLQAMLPGMSRQRRGTVVAIGSIAARRASRGNAVYGAAKAALAAYARGAAVEMAGRGITVNTVEPGYVDTAMLATYGDRRAAMEAGVPLRRFAEPGEIAAAVAYLFSPAARYVTGSALTVDGGVSATLGGGA